MAKQPIGTDAAFVEVSKELQSLLRNNDNLLTEGVIDANAWKSTYTRILAKYSKRFDEQPPNAKAEGK